MSGRAPASGRGPGARAAVAAAVAASVALLVAGGCARKLPPPGGKLDAEPARLVSTTPDSGAVGVSRAQVVEVTFSRPMGRREVSGWLCLGPHVVARRIEWQKNTVRYVPAESLRADQTYVLLLGSGAIDARGNPVAGARAIPFTTGPAFAPGEIGGRVEGRGHGGAGVIVWGYRDDLGHAADSTARDFDALGVAGEEGVYRLRGLPVPSRWRLYSFHDVNRTLSFEPGLDHLTVRDSMVVLTDAAPVADSVVLLSVDPTAPALVTGTVADSLAPPGSVLRVLAEHVGVGSAAAPGGRGGRVGSVGVEDGAFRLTLDPGRYRLRVYVDANHDGRHDAASEPLGEAVELEVKPGTEVSEVRLVAPPGPTPPPGGGAER